VAEDEGGNHDTVDEPQYIFLEVSKRSKSFLICTLLKSETTSKLAMISWGQARREASVGTESIES
jgi:hypothetical protein